MLTMALLTMALLTMALLTMAILILAKVAVLELDGLMRDTEAATQLLIVHRRQAKREQEAVREVREAVTLRDVARGCNPMCAS